MTRVYVWQEHCGGLSIWKYHFLSLHVICLLILTLGRHHAAVTGILIDNVTVPLLNATADQFVNTLSAKLSGNVSYKVVMLSHVLTTTAFRVPVAKVASLVKQHGALLLVDGAQAPGGISVSFHSTGADAYATSSHKWQLAPKGSAVLCMKEALRPLVTASYLHGGFGDISSSVPNSFGIKTSSTGAWCIYMTWCA